MPEPKKTPAKPLKAWIAPRLNKLGTIADVAAKGTGPQGQNVS